MRKTFAWVLCMIIPWTCFAADKVQLAVWANEAIVATYTFNYQTFLQDQQNIAKYFSANGWIAYTKALNASKLPDNVQKNNYDVSAVATAPPVITNIDSTHWQAVMPLLVVYTNPQYQQQQQLKVTIHFSIAQAGQGLRGYSISSLESVVAEPPCRCELRKERATTNATSKN